MNKPCQQASQSTQSHGLLLGLWLLIGVSGVELLGGERTNAVLSQTVPARLLNCLITDFANQLGTENWVRVAIEDRLSSDPTDFQPELSATRLKLRLAEGTLQSQLDQIAPHMPALTWLETKGILWLVNRGLTNSPLESRVSDVDYSGRLGGVLPLIHSFDNRIPEAYYSTTEYSSAVLDYHIVVKLKNGTIRDLLSVCLGQYPTSGLLFRFDEHSANRFPLASKKEPIERSCFRVMFLKSPTDD